MIKLMNLELKLDGGNMSGSDYEKLKNQYNYLMNILRKNSDKYGYPYQLGFMESYNRNRLGYNDEFDLFKLVKDMQEYVYLKRNELKGE